MQLYAIAWFPASTFKTSDIQTVKFVHVPCAFLGQGTSPGRRRSCIVRQRSLWRLQGWAEGFGHRAIPQRLMNADSAWYSSATGMDQRPQLKYFVKWKNVPTVLQHFRFYVPWRSHVITFTKCDPSLPSSPMTASSRSVPLCQEYNPRFPFAVSIMQDLQSVSGSTH